MAKVLKNTTGAPLFHQNSGTYLQPLYTTLPPGYIGGMLDAQMFQWFAEGKVVFSDGTDDFLDPAEGYSRFSGEAQRLALDSDGGILSRPKYATAGWSYTMRSLEFTTALSGSLRCQKVNPVTKAKTCWDDTTLKFFGQAGQPLLPDNNGIFLGPVHWTQLDFEPPHDIEIVGGSVHLLSDLGVDAHLSIIGAPDVPVEMGGQKHFISDINLRYIRGQGSIRADGRTSKRLTFHATYHTSRMRVLIDHPANHQIPMQILFEIFKP